jgi:LDH2 family malate/lactate/ureidoglycolate dehydrogenase
MASSDDYWIVEKDEMQGFMERCMLSVGTKPAHAQALAECLIHGDHRGHFSHGLNRLGMRTLFMPLIQITSSFI